MFYCWTKWAVKKTWQKSVWGCASWTAVQFDWLDWFEWIYWIDLVYLVDLFVWFTKDHNIPHFLILWDFSPWLQYLITAGSWDILSGSQYLIAKEFMWGLFTIMPSPPHFLNFFHTLYVPVWWYSRFQKKIMDVSCWSSGQISPVC